MKRKSDVISKMQALLLEALAPIQGDSGPFGSWRIIRNADAANDSTYFGPSAKKSACGALPTELANSGANSPFLRLVANNAHNQGLAAHVAASPASSHIFPGVNAGTSSQ